MTNEEIAENFNAQVQINVDLQNQINISDWFIRALTFYAIVDLVLRGI